MFSEDSYRPRGRKLHTPTAHKVPSRTRLGRASPAKEKRFKAHGRLKAERRIEPSPVLPWDPTRWKKQAVKAPSYAHMTAKSSLRHPDFPANREKINMHNKRTTHSAPQMAKKCVCEPTARKREITMRLFNLALARALRGPYPRCQSRTAGSGGLHS